MRRANGKLGVAMTESAGARVKTWREDVRAVAIDKGPAQPLAGPLDVRIRFFMPRPKSHYRTGKNAHLLRDTAPSRPVGKPDLDKLIRSTLDALTSAGTYLDDSQVVQLEAAKLYAGRGIASGAVIDIRGAAA